MANVQREIAKQYKPKDFSLDRKNTPLVENFIHRAEKYFSMIGLNSDAMRVDVASFAFQGEVATWWRLYHADQTMTWEQFKQYLRDRWTDPHDVQVARQKLRTVRQTSSFQTLQAELEKLFLRIPNISESEKADRLLGALKPEVQKQVRIQLAENLTDYRKLCTTAQFVDDTLFHYQRRERGSDMELGAMGQRDAHGRYRKGGDKQGDKGKAKHGERHNGKGKPDKRNQKCYKCGKKGHFIRDCPDNQDSGNGSSGRQ